MKKPGKRELGAAAVEFALVLPLLVTILFGGIDFGFVSNDTTKLRQVVRESGRRSAVWRFGRSLCEDSPAGQQNKGQLVGNHALGGAAISKPATADPDTRLTEARKAQCQLKFLGLEAGLDVRTKILVAAYPAEHTGLNAAVVPATPPVYDKQTADPNPPIDPATGLAPDTSDMSFAVVICAQYKTKSRTGFFGPMLNQKILRSRVSMRIARLNVMPTPFYPTAVEEQPLTIDGQPGNWSGCEPDPA